MAPKSSEAQVDTPLPPRLEVPTVALVAGVNMPDHDVLFEQLRTSIRMDGISPHVVLLKSKDCNSGMRHTPFSSVMAHAYMFLMYMDLDN